MARTPKTPKYEEFAEFANTFVFTENTEHTNYFNNGKPLILELGCGRAQPTLVFAKKYPAKNFVGIDLKADRLWRPAKTALAEKLANTVFVKMHIRFLDRAFKENSVEELWLTFSDPYPKDRQAKHRLTHPNFLKLYKKVLKQRGIIHFKTDSVSLFQWSLEKFAQCEELNIDEISFDLHGKNEISGDAKVVTQYENKFINEGVKINYCRLSV